MFRSAAVASPCPFDGIHAERKLQMLHLHFFFIQPKIKCRLFFFSFGRRYTIPSFVRTFPAVAAAASAVADDCEFGICVGSWLAAHRHYVAYALIIFTFILRSLDSVEKNKQQQ